MLVELSQGEHVKNADRVAETSTHGIAETARDSDGGPTAAAIGEQIRSEIPNVTRNRGNDAQTAVIADGSACRGEHTFSAPAHTEAAVQTNFQTLVEDARADLMKKAAAARMLGVASSLNKSVRGNPTTLGELHAFASATASTILAVGFLRPEVREAYREVLDAAIVLSNRVWQAQRAVRVAVEGVAAAGVAR